MPSRRDQIQSYQFAVQRVVSALVAREADPAMSPLRRLVGAGFGSVMIAVVALAAVGIFGLVTGRSGAGWRDGSAVILERETGASYVFRDGTLIPTANFASALLLLGSAPKTVVVPRDQLASVPRSSLVGILNAPDALPDRRRLLHSGWTICTAPGQDAGGRAISTTLMLVGAGPEGGQSLQDAAIVVRQGGAIYLVWHNHRYRINEPDIVLQALNLRGERQIPVGAAWLNVLPQGRAIQPIGLSDRGTPVTTIPEVPDAQVGHVLVSRTTDNTEQFYLVTGDRLRQITALEADIMLVRSGQDGPTPIPVGAAAVRSASPLTSPSPERAPDRRPTTVRPRPETAICTTFTGPGDPAQITVDAMPPDPNAGIPTVGRTGDGVALVDRIQIEPGRGVVVEAVPAPDAPAGPLFLVTDVGLRYAVPSHQVLATLGYGSVQPVRLPAGLVARLPEGPALDPAAARQPTG